MIMEGKKPYKKSFKKTDKVVNKPKRGHTDGSRFMVQGEGLTYNLRFRKFN